MHHALTDLTHRQMAAGAMLALGALLVIAGMAWVYFSEIRGRSESTSHTSVGGSGGSRPIRCLLGLRSLGSRQGPRALAPAMMGLALFLLVLVAGVHLRLSGLDKKTLSHTEAMIPGIELPTGISWPPERDSFYDAFWWHFHGEGHPQAYYFFMWGWTKVLGTSLPTLRMPSVIFGTASIGLVFLIGLLAYGRRVGLLGAALVAFNGLHIYFSQYARMFMMGSFLGLLSTFLLLQVLRTSDRRRCNEVAYVLVSWLAIYTQTFFWTLLAAQMAWAVLLRDASGRMVQRILSLQALVVILGAASLAHIVYRGDDVDLAGPSFSFVAQYLSFGFALQPDTLSIPPRTLPTVLIASALGASLLLVVRGLFERGRTAPFDGSANPIAPHRLLPTAIGSALVVLGLLLVVLRHQLAVAVVMLLPFLALGLPQAGRRVHALLASADGAPMFLSRITASRPGPALIGLLALLPPLAIVMLSFWTSMLIPRAFLMFVPYLLIVISAGVISITRWRFAALPVVAALFVIHAVSVQHHKSYPNDAIEYGELGQRMAERLRPGDLVFVVPESWVFTAIYYYLNDSPARYVAQDYADAVEQNPGARVWLLFFESARWGPYGSTTDEMTAALTGYRPVERLEARRGAAQLFVRDEGGQAGG